MKGRSNMRFSMQRQIVLQALQSREDYPNVQELYKDVAKQIPKISIGTIYRDLDTLVQNGQVRRIPISGFAARYTTDVLRKEHVVCPVCGRVSAIPEMATTIKAVLSEKLDGNVDYELMIYTRCKDCSRR